MLLGQEGSLSSSSFCGKYVKLFLLLIRKSGFSFFYGYVLQNAVNSGSAFWFGLPSYVVAGQVAVC